ncbi:ribosome-associated translation inhibitor RaiA [Candidatus Peregrinibacteria bacterium]|nr:ribosome-associated translation inhibitor RaiA [Candidatus Peregrinibacteria bacterium]
MQINIHTENLSLNKKQETQIYSKFEKLIRLADRLSDEASEIKVNLHYERTGQPRFRYACEVTAFVPRGKLRAETRQDTLENAVDDVIDKIKGQIEHYKSKLHHLEQRK